jgi:phosphoribosyl-ATP pyrophosphohydrolase/phosphoribosyl-AMP cyclohydrolase
VELKFNADGLVPVVVQDAASGAVLMMAYANAEALERTRATGRAHFWSRRRQEIWDKGATSGQVLELVDMQADCDGDTVLYRVRAPHGACHTGAFSCFGETGPEVGELGRLWATMAQRIATARAEDSYTRRLYEQGIDRVLRKVGEETAEFLVACKNQDPTEIAAEAADVLYHLWAALLTAGVPLARVSEELKRRREQPVASVGNRA